MTHSVKRRPKVGGICGINAGAKEWAMDDESGESTDKDDLTCERRETESQIKGLGCVWRNELDS